MNNVQKLMFVLMYHRHNFLDGFSALFHFSQNSYVLDIVRFSYEIASDVLY
jgi:hypothetical protein